MTESGILEARDRRSVSSPGREGRWRRWRGAVTAFLLCFLVVGTSGVAVSLYGMADYTGGWLDFSGLGTLFAGAVVVSIEAFVLGKIIGRRGAEHGVLAGYVGVVVGYMVTFTVVGIDVACSWGAPCRTATIVDQVLGGVWSGALGAGPTVGVLFLIAGRRRRTPPQLPVSPRGIDVESEARGGAE